MDLSKILVISGKPDLYELISHTKSGAIVESIVNKRRCPVFSNDRISALSEISMFTQDEDVPLPTVFQNIYRKEEGKAISFDYRKAAKKELFDYLDAVLPHYDGDRIYPSDVKKLYSWYDLLLAAGKIDLEAPAQTADVEAAQVADAEAAQAADNNAGIDVAADAAK